MATTSQARRQEKSTTTTIARVNAPLGLNAAWSLFSGVTLVFAALPAGLFLLESASEWRRRADRLRLAKRAFSFSYG
jgi:hypothetical protein